MTLTKEKAIELHRDLWDWLANNPAKDKCEWPGWIGFTKVKDYCFLCEYDYQQRKGKGELRCSSCPVEVPSPLLDTSSSSELMCLRGLYAQWWKTSDVEERSRLAMIIRDLPPTKHDFKVGDRVIYTGKGATLAGKTGTIIRLDLTVARTVCVEFDEYVNGHTGAATGETEGPGKPGHCRWCYPTCLVYASNSSDVKSQLSKPAINPLVEKTIAEWAQLLNIADWKIELEFVTSEEMAEIAETGDCIVDCTKDRVKKHAEICVDFECDEIQEGDNWKSLLASTLISIVFDELMFHTDCLVAVTPEGIRDMMSEQLDVYYERTINNLTTGFLAALNKPPRS